MRRLPVVIVLALAALLVGGGGRIAHDGRAERPTAARGLRPAPAPLQIANGPVEAADPGPARGGRAGPRPAARALGRAPAPLQIANGPVEAADPGRPPLRLRLSPAGDPVRVRFHDKPRSGLLFDLDTGEVLWRRLPDRVLPIASLTKMMTALIVAQRADPDARVKVTKEALAYQGSGVGVLPRGKRIKLETMLNGLLLPSGNDAAIALAQRISGTVAR